MDSIAPIVRKGVLLDIAGLQGVDALPDDFEITAEHLKARGGARWQWRHCAYSHRLGASLRGRRRNINNVIAPGVGIEAARWLSSRKIFAAGSDTVAFEKVA